MNYNSKLAELLENVTTWAELKTKLEQYNTSQTETTTKKTTAGKLFEYFAKYYFIVNPEYSQIYTKVWLYEEIPTDIKIKLNFPDRDFGIDLLLQNDQNNFTAVQCKFKNNEDYILKWKRDSIAHPFALAEKCQTVMIFTNAFGCVDEIEKREKFKQVAFGEIAEISVEVLQAIREYIASKTVIQLQKFSRLPHQIVAVEKTVQHLKSNERGQLILPCGAGKTLAALWIKEDLNSKNTLVLFPSLALLRQFKTEWANQRRKEYRYINICSEKDIDSTGDTTIAHTYEISGDVTTSPSRIKDFLETTEDNKVVFSTYQSIEAIEFALKLIPDFSFDLIICDEAHRTAGAKANTFAIVHDPNRVKGKKRLYMTATPKVASNSLKAKLGGDYELLCDMSKTEIFGEETHRMSFADAIKEKILVDYKIIGIGVTHKQVKEFIESRRFVDGKFDMKDIANNYALDIVMNKYSAFHAITFHSRVESAKYFAERHNAFFPDDTYAKYISGSDTTSKRSKILSEFKLHPKGVVSNAKCLTEGVDVPIIDVIYFCDPKNSKIDIVQASGRALRKDRHGKKPIGYIVVPIYHHIDDDIEKEIEKNPDFKNLIQVIRSLCDQDERLQAEINDVAFEKGEKKFRRVEITYNDSEIERVIKIEGLDKKVREFLFDQIIEKTRNFWEVMFKQLVDFKNKYNTTTISRKAEGMWQLGNWVMEQRRQYHHGRLEKTKIDKLNSIDFDWKGDQRISYLPPDEKWKVNYQKLKQYYQQNANSDVPARYDKDKALATWVVGQRVKYDQGRLTDEQIKLLEEINFNWDPKNTFVGFVESLKEYKKKHGHVRVPQGRQEFAKLARQVQRYRRIYNKGISHRNGSIVFEKFGQLRKEQINILNDLGFEWNLAYLEWSTRFDELHKFFTANGHSNVKQTDSIGLYSWCYTQRKNKNQLSNEELEKLKSVEFNFELQNDFDEMFMQRVIELEDYYKENWSFKIANNDGQNSSLRNWLSKVRIRYFKGNLPEEKRDLLKAIGYNFESSSDDEDAEWQQRFEELKEYYDKKHTFVFSEKDEYKPLRSWLHYQRKKYRIGKLSIEKKQKLNSIDYSFDKSYRATFTDASKQRKQDDWERRIEQLKNYYSKHKSFNVSKEDSENQSLKNWLMTVRQAFRNGALGANKTQQLEELGYSFQTTYRGIHKKVHITDQWLKRVNELKQFYAENGTFFLSVKNPSHKQLRLWVITQKSLHKKGLLSLEKQNLLSDAGFSFTRNYFEPKPKRKPNSHEDNWNNNLEALKQYYEINQTFVIPTSNIENHNLSSWLRTQRHYYNQSKLSKEREEKLKAIGYRFDQKFTGKSPFKQKKEKKIKINLRVSQWNEQYLNLIDFKMQNGHCRVPRSYEDKSLAYWVTKQRFDKNKNILPEEQIKKLELLSFEWDNIKKFSEKEIWMSSYTRLVDYYEKIGHSSPSLGEVGKQLVGWVQQQRHRKRKNILKQEYIDLLNVVHFNWNPDLSGGRSTTKDAIWLEKLNELVEFRNRYETTNVSQTDKNHKALGKWVNDQRHKFKKGTLLQDRIDMLNDIGFIWDTRKKDLQSLFVSSSTT